MFETREKEGKRALYYNEFGVFGHSSKGDSDGT